MGLGASSQVTIKPGLRAGVNFSKITQTDLDSKTDFYAGGFAAIKLSRFYVLQPEVNYSRQGAEGEFSYIDFNSGTDVTENVDLSLEYLSFAIVNKFTFNDAFNVHFGPTLDFLVNNNHAVYSEGDIGVTAGIGYKLPFGLEIEARVKKGFFDIVDEYQSGYDYYYGYYEDTNTNFAFQLGLSYSFDMKGTTK